MKCTAIAGISSFPTRELVTLPIDNALYNSPVECF